MPLQNPDNVVTEERLAEFYQQILPYMGGMPDVLANKFNRADLYSTDEKLIGRWIDGKPLYQKVINQSISLTKNNWISLASYVFDVDNCIKAYSVGLDGSTVCSDPLQTKISSGVLSVRPSRNDWYYTASSIIIQYTKTTDSAVEIGSDTDYSTTEKIVGTWIDGKPVYQKTIVTSTNATIGITSYIPIGASIDHAMLVNATLDDGLGHLFDLEARDKNDATRGSRVAIFNNASDNNKNTLQINNSTSEWVNRTVWVTLQYTKTSS